MTVDSQSWTYRNVECRLYRLEPIKQIGVVRVGDEWKEVVESSDMNESLQPAVEDAVDDLISGAFDDDTDLHDYGGVDSIIVDRFDDDPDPDPLELHPIWCGSGSVCVNTTDDATECVSLSDIDAADVDGSGRIDTS